MVRRAPFPRRSLPANIELFNEAIVCEYHGYLCKVRYLDIHLSNRNLHLLIGDIQIWI